MVKEVGAGVCGDSDVFSVVWASVDGMFDGVEASASVR